MINLRRAAATAATALGLALSALAAPASATSATPELRANTPASAMPSKAGATPATTYTEADAAALTAKLPKGAHVKVVSTRPTSATGTVSPAISQQGCSGTWGEQVYDPNCTAYGNAGTTGYIGAYATELFTDNNYGWITFNKDLSQYNQFPTQQCQDWEFFTGTHDTALLQYIHIDGWTHTTCGNWLIITF